jgi:hypothetical protein
VHEKQVDFPGPGDYHKHAIEVKTAKHDDTSANRTKTSFNFSQKSKPKARLNGGSDI